MKKDFTDSKYIVKDDKNVRDTALILVMRVANESMKSGFLLNEALKNTDKKDRAFLSRLVLGTLDRLITIDSVIDKFKNSSIKRIKPLIRGILRISVYQILYMDRVPGSAIVNEACELTKLHKMEPLKGFVNAILRNIIRAKESGEDLVCFEKEYIKYSVPEWLYEKFCKEKTKERAEKIFEAYLAERKTTVRFNLSKADEKTIENSLRDDSVILKKIDISEILKNNNAAIPKGPLPCMYEISGFGDLTELSAFKNGLIYVMDPSAALTASYASVNKGDIVFDVCAAPGGKSIHIADILCGTGHIESRDVSEEKKRLIEENIKRSGFKNISARVLDALSPDEESLCRADIVIADLPCSGLGVISKKPDIKLNIEEFEIEELQRLQRDILTNVSKYVKPHGKLVYSTCTLTKEENEENVLFIKEVLGFDIISVTEIDPSETNDGFFISVFKRHF